MWTRALTHLLTHSHPLCIWSFTGTGAPPHVGSRPRWPAVPSTLPCTRAHMTHSHTTHRSLTDFFPFKVMRSLIKLPCTLRGWSGAAFQAGSSAHPTPPPPPPTAVADVLDPCQFSDVTPVTRAGSERCLHLVLCYLSCGRRSVGPGPLSLHVAASALSGPTRRPTHPPARLPWVAWPLLFPQLCLSRGVGLWGFRRHRAAGK